jgi:hypothetical protein
MFQGNADDDFLRSSGLLPPLSEPHRKENPQMLQRIAFALSLVAVLSVAGTAIASNGVGPNKSSSSSISAPLVISSATASTSSTTTATTSGPRYGDVITFNVSTTATTQPYVDLTCYQNGALVGEGWRGFFDGALGSGTFGLSSPQWSGGAADCTANLDMYSSNKWKVLASTSFHVDA